MKCKPKYAYEGKDLFSSFNSIHHSITIRNAKLPSSTEQSWGLTARGLHDTFHMYEGAWCIYEHLLVSKSQGSNYPYV